MVVRRVPPWFWVCPRCFVMNHFEDEEEAEYTNSAHESYCAAQNAGMELVEVWRERV